MNYKLNPYPEGTIAYRIWERNKNANRIEDATSEDLKVIHLRIDGQTLKNISLLTCRSVSSVNTILQRYKMFEEPEAKQDNNKIIKEAMKLHV